MVNEDNTENVAAAYVCPTRAALTRGKATVQGSCRWVPRVSAGAPADSKK